MYLQVYWLAYFLQISAIVIIIWVYPYTWRMLLAVVLIDTSPIKNIKEINSKRKFINYGAMLVLIAGLMLVVSRAFIYAIN